MSVEEININQPDPDVIALPERLLDEAKRGEVQSFAIALSYGNYQTGNAWAGMGKNNMAIIGELLSLQQDLLNGKFIALRHQPVCYGED